MYAQLNRNKKKKKDIDDEKLNEQEAAKIYAEFVRSFEGSALEKGNKFVKSGKVLNPSSTQFVPAEDESRKKSKSKFSRGDYSYEEKKKKEEKTDNNKSGTGKVKEIDSFLEEIKLKQKILDERKILKEKAQLAKSEEEKLKIKRKLIEIEKNETLFSYAPKKDRVANLYLGNLSAEVTEEYLCQRFGKFGKVNSVKIMYPRTDEDKKKARISGFVCFENRDDAENARDALDGVEMFGNIVKVGWSKAIPKNLNTNKFEHNQFHYEKSNLYHSGSNKKIEILLPEDRKTKRIIDLLAKYVTEEGYTFEEAIKRNEKDNPVFTFLFNTSDLFYYYKWRVFSFAQGDSYKNWRADPFQMFENSYVYVPPIQKNAKKVAPKKEKSRNKKNKIDEKKKEKLINIINNLNRKRVSICRAMIFCTRHSDFSADIVKTISNYLTDFKYDMLKKINLVYLLSDILYNCSNQFYSSWSYRKHIEEELPRIFFHFRKNIKKCDSKIKAKMFTDSIMNIFDMWDVWAIYSSIFMNGLKCLLTNKKLNYVKNEIHESGCETDLDGTKIEFFDEIKRYPLNMRRNAYLYFQKEETHLNRLCEQRGLYFDDSFKRRKKIKYLILYDEFCSNVNSAPNEMGNLNVMFPGDGKKVPAFVSDTSDAAFHAEERGSNHVS
ncbi:U2 snRNP-associated SURP motif-containing protein, putative [Plasmodium vivax]|uniref:RNA binding protein, putative n=3 Tax=Plasmodium vivax TaxID=5855 RepID=A5K1J8_PLAVS|nr:RNA binding protein, putative [Plasmodium vivax]KMZ78173.1 RNA binding protein [Plasmodium vivax India VII]EDL47195.1 RNA binding protein, putative [Plasmodium vivax]CAI7723106.1 U2 snRNP-associated SURP motif-containing protein, putative [Plasmodium vivax]SCO69563.1 U2 snRNP-associated SURP motif-containing protein, putative [Plasmodium vivax]SCO75038.1 U2 snRNP-associated SURP motif-containing protein, putative [Plasmodium vivax]|eukprot:XP_001616922.1 RNA binding protein [Plasmodium vivax Sal-1]